MASQTDNTFSENYAMLNDGQRAAVDAIDGPVLVIAGPGTGKTQLLSMRVANILKTVDIAPQNILCLTFTDAAAINMRKRLRSIIGLEANKVHVNTFHGLGTEIINQNPDHFYKGADFKPGDDISRLEIVQDILSELPVKDPLASFHPEQGWVYAGDILQRIGDLKRGGFDPDDFEQMIQLNGDIIDLLNPIIRDFFDANIRSITKDSYNDLVLRIHNELSELKTHVLEPQKDDTVQEYSTLEGYENWGQLLLKDLSRAIDEADSGDKFQSKVLTAWRNQWCKKDEDNRYQLKDALNKDKFASLVRVYRKYQEMMYNKGLYDFDDMLLEVIDKLQQKPELRYQYQEDFQYILIDEFQDTNGAQLKLVNLMINTAVTNNKPNIMVVGDDEQAIYKFQGANIQNIISFKDSYDDVRIITLNQNYRSNQEILDLSADIISTSNERLAVLAGVDKSLKSNF